MNSKLILAVFFMGLISAPVFAQKKNRSRENRVVMVTGKPLTSIDSLLVKQLFLSALREKTIGSYQKAGEYFARVLDIDPQNDASMYELSNVYHLGRNDEKARTLLERAVTVKPENEWYWQALAKMYDFNTDYDKVEQAYAELIKINPEKEEYYLNRGRALYQAKKYNEALAVYDELEKKAGLLDELVAARQKVYLKTNKVDKAVADLQELIKQNPDETRYYLMLAEVYNANGQDEKALKILDVAKSKSPGSAMVQLALADVNRDMNNDEASFTALKSAFTSNDLNLVEKLRILDTYAPKMQDAVFRSRMVTLARMLTVTHASDARAWAAYGEILVQNEQLNEAKEAYKKAVALNNQLYPVWEQLVRIQISQGDFTSALKDGEEALSLFPNQALMNFFVGLGYSQKKDHQKAIGYFKTASELQSNDKNLLTQVYANLGDSYHAVKDNKRSDEAYEKALAYNPDHAFTLNNYAYYLSLRDENLAKAEKMSKRANELMPNTASFEDTYAWILFKLKRYANARTWMEKAIQHDGGKSITQIEHYGDILFHLGEKDMAIENWKKAKSKGAKSETLDKKIKDEKYVQ